MRFLFYSHDGFGLGHTQRHLSIAAALVDAAPLASVLLATGVDEASRLGLPPNVDTLKLPGLRKLANDSYCSRRLEISTGDIHTLRAELLLNAVKSFRPDLVLVDKHPFGAKGEFLRALEAARNQGAQTVLGLRDILDHPEVIRREWTREGIAERILDYYDLVLIYGNRDVFDALAEYDLAPTIGAHTRFCGFVVGPGHCAWRTDECPDLIPVPSGTEPVVFATAGGGEDGFLLLETFVRAALGMPWRAVTVAGPMMSQREAETLRQMARDNGVTFHRFIPCLPQMYGSIDAMVCMGGYNTLVELTASGVPTVCVPRTKPRVEQSLRAGAFERLGLLKTILPEELTAENLRDAIRAALQEPRQWLKIRAHAALGFDGARTAARHLISLLEAGAHSEHAAGAARQFA